MSRWQDFTIRELLVHRPPMLLLDEVVDYGHDHLVARLTVAADGVFVSGGSVPALLCFEYMVQAIAAIAASPTANRRSVSRWAVGSCC